MKIKKLLKEKGCFSPVDVICDSKNQKFHKGLEKIRFMLDEAKRNSKK